MKFFICVFLICCSVCVSGFISARKQDKTEIVEVKKETTPIPVLALKWFYSIAKFLLLNPLSAFLIRIFIIRPLSVNFWFLSNAIKFINVLSIPLMSIIKFFLRLPSATATKMPELVSLYGYPIETHEVQTQDGYILTMHRIHGGNGTVVMMNPGLLNADDVYLMNGKTESIPFALADKNMDVWLVNTRGTRYSQNHKAALTYKEYYDFTLTELGTRDVPAFIDYILNTTQQSQLAYIGYSRGTTDAFITLSEKPEYNEKVSKVVLMAPVASFKYTPNELFKFAKPLTDEFEEFLPMTGMYELIPDWPLIELASVLLCNRLSPFVGICEWTINTVVGKEIYLNKEFLSVFLTHVPKQSGMFLLLHYMQMIKTGKFLQYDYGKKMNMIRYSSETPPEFDLSKITAKLYLLYGTNDILAGPTDVESIVHEMGLSNAELKRYTNFSHLDFVQSTHGKELKDYVLEVIESN